VVKENVNHNVLTKFTMPNGGHIDAHIIYDLTAVYLFKFF